MVSRGRRCPSGCRCGKHNRQSGGLKNPFRHAARDFGNMKKFFTGDLGKAIAGSAARGIIAVSPLAPLGPLVNYGLKQGGLGRRRRAVRRR